MENSNSSYDDLKKQLEDIRSEHDFLKKQQLKFSSALDKITEIILYNNQTTNLLVEVNNILGETLQTDRSLIYYVSAEENSIIGLCEWLNEKIPGIQPTIDTYPLDYFRVSHRELITTQKHIESHEDHYAKSFTEEGSGELLHPGMNIKSLIWYPFDFENENFYLFALNQNKLKREWTREEIQFIGSVAKQVSVALMKIKLSKERNQLIRSKKMLQELNATKDKFFSIISHDLRSPFNTILGFNELLIENAGQYSPKEVQRFAQEMYKSSKQAFTLLENLLHWSRVQTGKLHPAPQTLHPEGLIEELVQLKEADAEKKHIKLIPDIQASENFYADREMIKTALRNLVTNALKYTHQGGTVIVKAEKSEKQMQFTVSDTGIGIEKEYLPDLFKIDCNVSKPGTDNESGTGLGLILCKEFVEINHGKIWVESELGKGSDFKFTIPLSRNNA